MTDTKKATRKTGATFEGFTEEERAAMKEHAKEMKTAARRSSAADKAAQAEAEVLAKIAEMPQPDRQIAERLHTIVKTEAPNLAARTWYGQPAYAKDGKVLCFFQSKQKFNTRYATLGFNDVANLDDDAMWPTAYALTELTPAVERKITALIKKAAA